MVPAGGGTQAPAVVLLHSGVADRRMWVSQVRELEQDFRVLAPDLRGFGARPHVPGPFSHAGDVLALLDAEGIEQAAVVGSSLGGRVALEVAGAAPERVSALVLLCAAAPLLKRTDDVVAFGEEEDRLLGAGDLARAVELNVRTWLGPEASPQARDLVRTMQSRAFALDRAAESLSPPPEPQPVDIDLVALTMPALVVGGGRDLDWFQQTARHLAESLPRAELVILDWAGHLPSLERPDEVSRLVADFLERALRPGP